MLRIEVKRWRGRTEFSYSYLIACSATDFVDVLPSAMRVLCTPKGTMWITWRKFPDSGSFQTRLIDS
ncbi:unnamed protein product [Cylicocyclus nassatus]|uniref:Uncharacterized protein n=1 Tax=Cylicocyclus nassatus TaxID=53992 RepID=A0AA36DS70_CYLNA|nr:unnamed protein product [Cylicocyclus nassatus]